MASFAADRRFDLHTHSNISDGTDSPAEIALLAAEAGLSGFSLTDHDTIQGWQEAREAAREHGIDFLPGIELTTHQDGRSMHLLVYGPDQFDDRLNEELLSLREARSARAIHMIDNLSRDFDFDAGPLRELAALDGSSVGRPHLADALIGAGYFENRADAFATALSPRGKYYVPTRQLETVEAIKLATYVGGFPVLAHPAAFRMRAPIDPLMVSRLTEIGLQGIELHHPENKEEWLPDLFAVAQELDLLVTGSSDYHGTGKPNLLGEKTSDLETVAFIRDRVATTH